jgi:hypothetical protein
MALACAALSASSGRPALGASAATYNRAGLIARICSKTCSVVSGLQNIKNKMGILYIVSFI